MAFSVDWLSHTLRIFALLRVALDNTVIKQQVEIVKQQVEIVKQQVDINQLSSFVGVLMLTGSNMGKKIKMIRCSGVSTCHPTKLVAADGSEYSPSAQDLVDLINVLCDRQVVMPALRSCALAPLDNIM
jgi:hypothetical protein